MVDFEQYSKEFRILAQESDYPEEAIVEKLDYAEKLNNQNLPIIFDQYHLSLLVGYDYDYLLAVANAQRMFYRHYTIPKKSGGERHIEEPMPALKEIQEWILINILNPASKRYVSPVAKAFIPGKSLKENARFHRNRRQVVALDLKDFFGSVKFGPVYGVFIKLGYTVSVAVMLTKLCMMRGSLPQGAPTSPMLSNLIFYDCDTKIFHYCRSRNIMYTRYADDLTFSGDDLKVNDLISYVKMLLAPKRLYLNEKKTKVMGKGCRQMVTGVVVNSKLQVSKQYRNKVRQEVYYCIKYGIVGHVQHAEKPQWITKPEHYRNYLIGKLRFILQINPQDTEFVRYLDWLKNCL